MTSDHDPVGRRVLVALAELLGVFRADGLLAVEGDVVRPRKIFAPSAKQARKASMSPAL
jgi:hypothetical protein